MRDSPTDTTWQLTEVAAALDAEDPAVASATAAALLAGDVEPGTRALLEEAMALTRLEDPRAVLRVALRELVERQRFLSWVARHDPRDPHGNA